MVKKICFMGYGNTIRKDDGIGPYTIRLLEKRLEGDRNFTFITLHQIDPALAPSLLGYDEIIFIDAAADIEEDVLIKTVTPDAGASAFTTHASSVHQLVHLIRDLYNASPVCSIVQVRGYEFGFGEGLSEKGRQASMRAVEVILAHIRA